MNIPNDLFGSVQRVQFFFYGHKKCLSALSKELKSTYKGTKIILEQGFIWEEKFLLEAEILQKKHDLLLSLAKQHGVEYDGFGIDTLSQSQKSANFADFFQAGDIFSYLISENQFIVGQYLGGSWQDLGCFYQIYDEIFSEQPNLAALKNINFVYKQPVLMKISPENCTLIGHANHEIPYECYFRCEIGEQSSDYFYENNLLANDSEGYMDILLSMYQQQQKLAITHWKYFKYTIDKKGKIDVKQHINANSFAKLPTSYLFGVVGDMTMAASTIKREYRDMIFLQDNIFCDKSQ